MYETASPDGVESHALEPARQHAGRPLARGDRLHLPALALRDEDDEARQIFRLRAQSIQHPRPDTRPSGDDRSAVHERMRGIVIDLLGPHRSHDAGLVDDAADMRKQLADHLSRLAEPPEAVRRAEAGETLPLELGDLLPFRERLRHRRAVHFRQLGLVVERLQVRGPARLVQIDDALGLRRKVERVDDARWRRLNGLCGGGEPRVQQRVQRHHPQSSRAPAEERSTVHLADEVAIHVSQFLVISSCRFNTARVTVAIAASGAGRRRSGGSGASPVLTNCRALSGSAAKRFRLRS